MRDINLKITPLQVEHISQVVAAFSAIGWHKPASIYEQYLQEQAQNTRKAWLAFQDEHFVGYVTLNLESLYFSFKEQNIPEIMDLNVLPTYRQHGVGSYLLDIAEKWAFDMGYETVGLGVGLHKDYGAAQRLYIKHGYIPDGLGVTYNYVPTAYDESVKTDDDLVLWLTKSVKINKEEGI